MKNVSLAVIFVVLIVSFSVFMVGFYSGNVLTGKIIFGDLLKQKSIKNPSIVKGSLIGAIHPKKPDSGFRIFSNLKGKTLTTGCNLLSVDQAVLSSVGDYKNGFSVCSYYGYDVCVQMVADKGGYSAVYDCTYNITCGQSCPPYTLTNQFGEVEQVNSVAVNCCNTAVFLLPPVEKLPQKIIEPVVGGKGKISA